MENLIIKRPCFYCGKGIKGRTDKKFCNDICRNQFNNKSNQEEGQHIRNINRILNRNRRILRSLLPKGSKSCSTTTGQLAFMQFHFSFYTHTHTNKNGNVFHFCYEFGYLTISQDKVIVVNRSTHLCLLSNTLQIP